jgi:predicted DNA-binding transcriptional regulator YafY
VYLGAVVVVITAMQAGITPARARHLHAWLGVSVRTLQRWRTWWRATFVTTAFWRAVQGRFVPPVAVDALPTSLCDRFLSEPDERAALARVLRFLGPLTTTSVSLGTSLVMAARDPQTMQLVSPASPA